MRNATAGRGRAAPIGANGTLWFPTQDGVVVIDPETIAASTHPVPPRIESVLIDRAAVPLGAPVRIVPGQQAVEIQYTGMSLVNSERIRFRYRMNGLDHEWVDAGTRRTAYYSHLPPGDYTFSVMAAGSDGVWTTDAASLAIRVVPPFWRTWWFLLLATMTSVGAAGFAYHRRVAVLEAARARAGTLHAPVDRFAGARAPAHRRGAARQPGPASDRDQEPRAAGGDDRAPTA